MEITTKFEGVYLHYHGDHLIAITLKGGEMKRIEEMREKDREELYGVDKVQPPSNIQLV